MVSMILPGVVVKIAHGYCLERHLFMEQGVVERLLSDNEEADDNGQIIRGLFAPKTPSFGGVASEAGSAGSVFSVSAYLS